ncbi:unnamed protein product [Caretta caretta]
MAGLEKVNQTTVTAFLLVGFETRPKLQITLFVMFFIIYLATIARNILLVLIVWTDHYLHTPMYFVLSNLSFLETGYVSNVIPGCCILTIASYVYVILTILRIPSIAGSKKAFSTCSSHLIVVSTFYGALIIMYVAPSGNQSLDFNKMFSLRYMVVTPMFNPIVYSLRNKDMKDALGRVIHKIWLPPKM